MNQIKAKAYERSLAEGKSHNFPLALPEHLAEQAEEALTSSYNLEFLGIRQQVKERELEDRLINRLRDFILELGYAFCFIRRRHRITLGRNEYFIDLLFYLRLLKALGLETDRSILARSLGLAYACFVRHARKLLIEERPVSGEVDFDELIHPMF